MRLATIFYCLRFDTSLFVASYDSQGYGGRIRPRLHTGFFSSRQANPLKLTLGVSAIGHLDEQFIFLAVMQTILSLLREQTFT
jgi:hypothetical protein